MTEDGGGEALDQPINDFGLFWEAEELLALCVAESGYLLNIITILLNEAERDHI